MTSALSLLKYAKKIPGANQTRAAINGLLNLYLREKHVAMLHTGRCGSTVLGNMLNAHSQVFWGGEIFESLMNPEGIQNSAGALSGAINSSRARSVSKIFGFETNYLPQQHLSDNCLNICLENYVSSLRDLGFSYFIVLNRKNYLRRAISIEIGRQKSSWHSKSDVVAPTKIRIDPDSFQTGYKRETLLKSFSCMEVNYSLLCKLVSDNCLVLNYEDDVLADPRVAYKKVCRFLKISDESPKITLKRTNPFSYEQMIINFDEVSEALKNTNYSWMLDD